MRRPLRITLCATLGVLVGCGSPGASQQPAAPTERRSAFAVAAQPTVTSIPTPEPTATLVPTRAPVPSPTSAPSATPTTLIMTILPAPTPDATLVAAAEHRPADKITIDSPKPNQAVS